MIIIGEKLNSSIPKTLEALTAGDENFVIQMIQKQTESGADYLDINTALCGGEEISKMLWVTHLAMENSTCGIMLDSPNPDVITEVISSIKNRTIIINSITLEEKYNPLIEVAKTYGAGLVCLPIDTKEIPHTAEKRFENAEKLIEKLRKAGIPDENIYIDVLIEAIATNQNAASAALSTIQKIKAAYPTVNTLCGLSNISFGMPKRALLNTTFFSMAMAAGLDSAIIDSTSEQMQNTFFAANTLLGKDEFCMEYIDHMRK